MFGQPVMEEAEKLFETGCETDVLSDMPPFDLRNGTLRKRPLDVEPGTKRNAKKASVRGILVRRVKIWPLFLFCFDGATTLALSGVSLAQLAETLYPGCSSPDSPNHHMIRYRGRGRRAGARAGRTQTRPRAWRAA